MTKRHALMMVFGAMMVFMTVVTIQASREQNLFDVLPRLWADPWTNATLKDFYNNILLIFVWVAYRERSWIARILWLMVFIVGGSIGTSLYVFIQLWTLKPGESLDKILVRKARPA